MRYIYIILFFGMTIQVIGQDVRLANKYYQSGEYEKAAKVYLKLFKKTKNNDYYFSKYIESLLAVDDFEAAENAIRGEIKKRPRDIQLYVTLGNMYEKQGQEDKAEKEYRRAIQNMPNDIGLVSRIGNAFAGLAKYDLAIEVYEKGEKLTGRSNYFAYNLAGLYGRKGDKEKMINAYLNSIHRFQNNTNNLITILQRELDGDEDYELLQKVLYERIQEGSEYSNQYNDILEWTFITKKQYKRAFRQARSLDRANEENGGRVNEIAEICYNAGAYDVAIEAYEYIIKNKGKNSTYYLDAKRGLLNSKRKKLLSHYDYTSEELDSLEAEYLSFLDIFGRNSQTALLMTELADFEALYRNDLDAAIDILQEVVDFGGVNKFLIANAKLDLGDYLLMKGDIWEATLLYSQVDKQMKEGLLGEQARFKNAMLSYYHGDFEWAQEQFDILKTATSKLISNDAIDMSVFIMDNLGLDTTDVPLKMFAQSDLLIFQNKFDEAISKMDSILILFPKHGLQDDILFNKAKIYTKKRQYDKAIAAYEKIIKDFPEEIKADNSIFALAEIYEHIKNDKEKAKALYEKLFLDYSNSTLAIEARKRFRILRGDDIQ